MAGLKNVLLTEDDAMVRQLYQMTLADNGYNVEVSESVDEMYAKLEKFHPDVVFLDVMLPGTSGLKALKELRTNPVHGCQDIKIVVLTNLAQRNVADNAMENGADGFIIKADILPTDLPRVIDSLEEDMPKDNDVADANSDEVDESVNETEDAVVKKDADETDYQDDTEAVEVYEGKKGNDDDEEDEDWDD